MAQEGLEPSESLVLTRVAADCLRAENVAPIDKYRGGESNPQAHGFKRAARPLAYPGFEAEAVGLEPTSSPRAATCFKTGP